MAEPPSSRPSFSTARRWRIGWNVLLSILAVAGLVVMANYLALRHYARFQWTADERFELSPLSRQILQSLTNTVQVTVFYDRDELYYSAVTGLLREYAEASPRIQIKTVDYTRYPDEALLLKARYQIASPVNKDMVIFDCEGRVRIVYQSELSEYDLKLDQLMEGKHEVKRTGFKGEMLFTAALVNVSDPKPQKAYYVVGHGEHPLEETGEMGYSKFHGVLKSSNIEVEPFSLRTNAIPADCQVLLIASPRLAFLPEELDRIDQYLNRGGRLLAAFSYFAVTNRTGLESLLRKWGVEVGFNVILDPKNSVKEHDLFATEMMPDHPIMKPLVLENTPLYLNLPRTIRAIQSKSADAPKTLELVSTSPTSTTVAEVRAGIPSPGPRDVRGSAPVVVSVEKGQIEGISAGQGATRILVLGDSTFLANFAIENLANRAFAGFAVNWLLDRSTLIGGLGPRPIAQYEIRLSKTQLRSVQGILLGVFPGAILACGFLVWFRRRA